MARTSEKPLKISYCTTCKGRLHHLQQTLPANMEAEKGNPNVEFVVLDYGSEDGLGDWIKENFQEEIATGRLIYARTESPYFKMAHAKNMAHRLANGDVLCNLDADNFIGEGYSRWLQEVFTQNMDVVTNHGALITRVKGALIGESLKDTRGRIAVSRDNFNLIAGYNEYYSFYRGGDNDFTQRAKEAGLQLVNAPCELLGSVISHGHDNRMINLSPEDRKISRRRLHMLPMQGRLERLLTSKDTPPCSRLANHSGDVGCGDLHINFAEEVTSIKPLAQPLSEQSETATRESGQGSAWSRTVSGREPSTSMR